MDLDAIRREYLSGGLNRKQLHPNPLQQFAQWMDQAIAAGLADPTAMTLATVNACGQPRQRIVLLKHIDAKGFVFFTNFTSAKAEDIAANSQVSLHFPWHGMERQVSISGTAAKVADDESLQYFLSRPRDSQIAAWASRQSQPLSSRQALLARFATLKQRFGEEDVPMPDFWGGFRVQPHHFEFWQGGGCGYTIVSLTAKRPRTVPLVSRGR